MKFEDCFDLVGYNENSKPKSLFEWFINQGHVPFDISSDAHRTYIMYLEFIKNLEELYFRTGHIYFWFKKNGVLVSSGDMAIISVYSIKINTEKIREYKIEEIIK